jgi:hypothetical protein
MPVRHEATWHMSDQALRDKYGFAPNICCLRCLGLGAESIDDLARMLRDIGYSPEAVEQILKWYKNSNS